MSNKYDFELDMNGENSNSLILREILPNSDVLEFGPAHGRMTKYLKENLNCKVSIVEKNYEAGEQAKRFAEHSFIGDDLGDIEKYHWLDKLNIKFDYIIFADVLEHLYDPWKVLTSIKNILKEDGLVLISIPNISHNAVIIDLLNGKFDYRDVGLLDNTHIRFFTNQSLLKLVHEAGFEITKIINTHNSVENTEFKNSFEDVPIEIAEYLKQREFGDVYQFVWALNKANA